ncbi:MAG: secretin N-terminal domain-containing protein [Phycisphaerae bacterium]
MFALMLLMCLGLAPAMPDERPAAPPAARTGAAPGAPATEVCLVSVKSVSAEEVAGALVRALDIRAAAIRRPACVVISGTADEVHRAKALIERLDHEVAPATASPVKLFELTYAKPEEVVKQVMSVLREDVSIAIDPRGRRIIARASAPAMESIESLIKQLDTRTPDDPADSKVCAAQLEFCLMSADASAGKAADLPADLAEVGKELARFGQVQLRARLATQAVQGQPYEVAGELAGGPVAEIHGEIESAKADGSLTVRVKVEVTTPPGKSGAGPQGAPARYRLNTTIMLQRGSYAAVGMAPFGSKSGETGIVVLHAR